MERSAIVYEDLPSATAAAAAAAAANASSSSSFLSCRTTRGTVRSHSTGNFRTKSNSSLFVICQRSEDSGDEVLDDDDDECRQPLEPKKGGRDAEGGSGSSFLCLPQQPRTARRASLAAQLYSSLARRRSMSRLTPLSISMSSSHSGQPLGEGLQEEEEDEDEGGVEDQDEEEEEDNVDEEDANNNPLVEVHSPNHQLTTNTFERTLKITPSIVRRLPIRSGDKRFPGRIRKRVIHKNGNVNLSPEHVDKRHRRFMQDMFTTMVDIRWRWNLLVFTMGFLISWFSFAVVWWLIAFSHSDFEHPGDLSWSPCVNNLNSFASAILFSIETQHTIGYGSRYTTEECPEAMFVMCLQSITGVMIQCFMVGFVFAKLSRPQKRSQTLMFSRHAVTCLRDGKLCLMFRVGDLRDKSHIIGAAISAQLIRRRVTEEGEVIPYYHQSLSVRFDDAGTDLFLIWPAVIIHEINSESPFYMMNCEAMMKEKFEIVVILEGTVESTGQSVQARTSYLPAEILWGHRFEQLVQYRNDSGEFTVDYSKFNNTFPVDIATYSGKEFHEDLLHRERQRQHQYGTPPTSPPTSPPTTTGNGQQYSTGGRPSIPPPPPPPSQLLTESQRERIKFYEH